MKNLDCAYASLIGLWIGDAFGGHFEFEAVDWKCPKRAEQKRELPPPIWRYTDDTLMALSVYDVLRQYGEIDSSKLANSFGEHFDIDRGYGAGAEKLLLEISQEGGDWKTLAEAMFNGTGSFGNGSAMRVAPIGAYFADDMAKVVENARRSSIVTHTHTDGISGAIAVAVASAQASLFSSSSAPDTEIFWETILDYTPVSMVRENIEKASTLDSLSTEKVANILGSGWDVSAVDTVPFALWVAIHHITDFKEALWQAISVGGDSDTIGAMVGGIIASYGGIDFIPQHWQNRCEPLPVWINGWT